MKLINLKVCGIRGFNLEREINLDDGLTVIYGPNGQGKTSFVEAIEWVIFGTIFKKDRAPSKVEYRDTIKNAHFSCAPYVEAVFQNNGGKVKLRREYVTEDDSNLFIDGKPAEGIGDLGISDTVRPIIYQHGLKSFIYAKPKERYLEFMKLLNIEELDTFLQRIRDARNHYKRSKPRKIRDARLFLDNTREDLPEYHALLIEENFDPIKLCEKINEELGLFDEEITASNMEKFREALVSLTERTRKDLFDLDIFSPIISFEPIEAGKLSDDSKIKGAIEVLARPEIALAKNRLNVLKNGLKVIEATDTEECPLCFEDTITEGKVDLIISKYKEDNALEKRIKKAQKAIKAHLTQIEKFRIDKLSTIQKLAPEEEEIKGCEKFGIKASLVGKVVELNGKAAKKCSEIEDALERLEQALNGILNDKDSALEEFAGISDAFNRNLHEANQILASFSGNTEELKDALERKISSADAVKRIESISSMTQNIKKFKILEIDSDFEKRLEESIKNMKSFRDILFQRKLSHHKDKIIEWYDVLNPHEDVRICDIECKTDKVNFIAETYGVKRQAVPLLSEAHLNCLGLSIFLSNIVSDDNPFGFILIDDPVQSLDAVHTDNFINEVMEKLIDKGLQIFIFSHLSATVTTIILTKYKEVTPTNVEFYGWNLEGPKIKIKKENRFGDYISLAEQNYNGDLEQRKSTANTIRSALEAYTKEYYYKKSGKKLPKKYEKAQFSVLDEKLLSQVPINGNERGRLRTINQKCNKPSHDDQIFEPPTSTELRGHIDTLKGLYKKHILEI